MKYKIARLFYPYGAVRRVLRGPLRGYQFIVAPGYGLTYALSARELHLNVLDRLVSPGMTVFDIGANRGLVSLLFSHRTGERGKVFAFEPIEELNHDFTANMKLNQVTNVHLVQAAVSHSNGEVLMEYSPENSTQGKLQTVEPGLKVTNTHSLTVRTVALDDYVEAEGVCPDLIKIDVEGAAGFVFSGAGKVLSQMRPTLFVELHGEEEQASIAKAVREYGYKVYDTEGILVENVLNGWHSPIICRPE